MQKKRRRGWDVECHPEQLCSLLLWTLEIHSLFLPFLAFSRFSLSFSPIFLSFSRFFFLVLSFSLFSLSCFLSFFIPWHSTAITSLQHPTIRSHTKPSHIEPHYHCITNHKTTPSHTKAHLTKRANQTNHIARSSEIWYFKPVKKCWEKLLPPLSPLTVVNIFGSFTFLVEPPTHPPMPAMACLCWFVPRSAPDWRAVRLLLQVPCAMNIC